MKAWISRSRASMCSSARPSLASTLASSRSSTGRVLHELRGHQCAGELGEDGEVGVKPDSLKPTGAKRRECPFVLEASELALDTGTASVELAPAGRLARDQRVQTVGL